MISVVTTAYNHQNTLQRAIDSVQSQIGVEYEHIIIDDTKTHNGMMRTYQMALKKCTGDYIAFCDGDDYWIDEYKLARQLRYMEKNPDCGLCITLVYTEKNGIRLLMPDADFVNANMSFDALLKGNAYINAQSYLIRKSDFDKYIDFDYFVKNFNTWDYPIVLELIKHARIHCLNFYSAVYTVNEESVTNTRDRKRRIKYLIGNYKIKWYYIRKYGCKFSTKLYLIYKILRNIYSVGAKRWT